MHIAEAKRRLDTKMPWLCDSMSNDLKHAFGDRNNSEFVIGADGKVLVARAWSDPGKLRADLERIVGGVDEVTTLADLGRKPAPVSKGAARGVVPKIERPANLEAIKVVPKKNSQPFYVKLRAEAERSLLDGGKGKLLLGFHLDPIHHVHWNNLAAPLKYSITVPQGSTVTPSTGVAAKLEVEADGDPREFVVEIEGSGSLVLRVDYFACHDVERWCKAVSQEYTIVFERDRDAGRVMAGRGGGSMISRMLENDANGDGKISREEAPQRMLERFAQLDADGDGFVSKAEFESRTGSRGRPRR